MNVLRLLMSKGEIISIGIVIITLIYYIFGKSTWHYYPIYLLGIFHFFLFLFSYFEVLDVNPFNKTLTIALSLVLPIVTYLLLVIFPTMELPLPSGDFMIGTQTFELRDESRAELYADGKNMKRRLKYQVWYPTDDVKDLEKEKW